MSADRKSKTVLVVDDDSIFHFLIKKMLLELSISAESIQTALSGKDALDQIVNSLRSGVPLPDIILLDLNMPMMGGFDFLEAYQKLPLEEPEKTRIFIISSSLNNQDITRSLQLGATRYLIKPVTEVDLLQVLR